MITKLTKEQKDLIPKVRDEWINRALKSNGSLNQKASKELIYFMYELAELPDPITIFVDSPLAAQIAAQYLKLISCAARHQVRDQVGAQVKDQVWDQVRDQVGPQVKDQVWAQVWDQVRDQVRDQVKDQVRDQVGAQVGAQVWDQVGAQVGAQVWDQVWDQVRDQVGDQVGAQVKDQVWDQVWDQVRDQVWDQVGAQVKGQVWDQVWDQVGAQVKDQVWGQVWDQVKDQVWDQVWDQVRDQVKDQVWDQVRDQVGAQVKKHEQELYRGIGESSYRCAFFDFFEQVGITVPENFRKFKDLLKKDVFWDAIAFEGVCIAYPPPSAVRRDQENRLHSDQKPAIEWKDGYNQHYLRGVFFDEKTFSKIITQKFRIEDLMQIENADRRAVAVSMLKPELLLSHMNAKHLDTGTKGTKLYSVKNFMDTGREEFCMTMECPSTGRLFLEWVDPDVGKQKDADLAQASAWLDENNRALSIEDYLTMEEA